MSTYFKYLIGSIVFIILVATFVPKAWYQYRAISYRTAMLNFANQIGFSSDDAILQGSGLSDCSIVLPSCTCYQFSIFPTDYNLTEFQRRLDTSGLDSVTSKQDYSEDELFFYLGKTHDVILKVNDTEATWDYFKTLDKKFNSFYWDYTDHLQKKHFIEFFGIGEANKPLQLFDKPFSGNFVVIDTKMGSYPSWACESGAKVIK